MILEMTSVSNRKSHICFMRNVKRVICGFVILFLSVSGLFSQSVFYSQSLQNLYYSLPPTCRIENPAADTIVFCSEIIQGFNVPLIYNVDRFGILAHIGYRLLPDSTEKNFLQNAVITFLERETLSLLVVDNLDQKLTNNRENGLTLLYNGSTPRRDFYRNRNGLPDLLQRIESIDIRYEDRIKYQVTMNCGQGQTLKFIFEADAELLSNMDKKERDEQLAAQLKNHQAKTANISIHAPLCDSISMLVYHDSAYVCLGSEYMIPQMNSNLYYLKTDSTYKLAFGKNWVAETLANVLLAYAGQDYTMQITHRQYGGVINRYEVTSLNFFDYFSGEYDRYFGIESLDRDTLNGTLMLADRNTGSIHIAFVSVSLLNLLNGGIMEIQLDTNIPQHNIETLFGKVKERNSNRGQFEINIK